MIRFVMSCVVWSAEVLLFVQQLEPQQLPQHLQDTLKDLVARLQAAYKPSYLDMSAARTLTRTRLSGECE